MKVGKLRAIALIPLACLLLLNVTACSWISGDDSSAQQSPTPAATPQLTVAEAQENLRRAESEFEKARQQIKDLDKAEAAAKRAREAANAAKKTAEDFRAETINSGKNPDDPQEAPKTYKAAQAWQEAEAEAKDAERRLADLSAPVAQAKTRVDLAKQALEEAQKRERPTQGQSTQGTTSTPTVNESKLPLWVTILLPLLALLALAEGVAGFLLFRNVIDNISAIQKSLGVADGDLKYLRQKQDTLPDKMGALINSVPEKTSANVASLLQGTMSNFGGKLDAIRQASKLAQSNPRDTGYGEQATISQPKSNAIEFPITAEDYLSRVESDLVPVKHDFLRTMLVSAADGEGVMFLVNDGSAPGNTYYVVPRHKRFQSKADFMHYSDYFDCPNPAGGEITIIKPARVFRASGGGGWQLHDKGELKV